MENEQTGIIYRITNTVNNMEYYGLSTGSLAERKKGHKCAARRCAEGHSEGCRKLYHAMNAHGFECFKFEVVETVPLDKLGDREIFWIAERKSIHPGGYNLTSGGEHHRHNNETKQRISDKCKTHEFSKGLPMYATHKPHGKSHSFRISDHPLCSHKEFSEIEYGSVEAAKQACIEFIKILEEKGEKYNPIPNKSDPTLRKGLSKLKNGGYRVGKTYNGKLHERVFQNMSSTDEERRLAAEQYLTSLEEKYSNN